MNYAHSHDAAKRIEIMAREAIKRIQLSYNYPDFPIRINFIDDPNMHADGGLAFGDTISININLGTIVQISDCCTRMSARIQEYGVSKPHWQISPDLNSDLGVIWIILHEYYHIVRNHTDSSNPAIREAEKKIGDDQYIVATELDADLMACVGLYRFLAAGILGIFHGLSIDPTPVEIGTKLKVVTAIYPFFALLDRNEQSRGSGRYLPAYARMMKCFSKIVTIDTIYQAKPGIRAFNKVKSMEAVRIASERLKLCEQVYCDIENLEYKEYMTRKFELISDKRNTMDDWEVIGPILNKNLTSPTLGLM